MEHVEIPLGERHPPHNFAYADQAEREAAVITSTSLLDSLALQLDDGSYWRLAEVDPAVWVPAVATDWDSISGKPSTFPPSAHTHAIADVTDLQGELDGKEPLITKSMGYATWNGSAWVFLNQTYMQTSHDANDVTAALMGEWNTAYAWGDHAAAGYELQDNKDSVNGYVGMAGWSVKLRNAADTFTNLLDNETTEARAWTMPDKDGTVAMLDDITGDNTGTNTGDETGARIAALNHAASEKTSLVNADEITGQDSAAGFGLIRTTWADVKAFLKTYFDTIYQATLGYTAEDVANKSTNLTADAGSNTKYPSAKAVADYVAAAVTGLLEFKGSTDCSGNPNYPAASKGDSYIVSVAGKIGGASGTSVDSGDMYFAIADNAGGTQASVGASWTILEHNLAGVLLAANDLSDLNSASTARTNLGLGTLATQNGTFSGDSSGTNTGDETGARIAALNHAASTKSALVNADEITGQDSAASFGLIRTTWADVKAFLKTYFDTLYPSTGGAASFTDLTTTGNTTLGNASTDTLNVGNGGIVKDASGNVGLLTTPAAWHSSRKVVQIGTQSAINTTGNNTQWTTNYYANTSDVATYIGTGFAMRYNQDGLGSHTWQTAVSGTAGNPITWVNVFEINAAGNGGLGVTPTATARLSLAAGTTSVASLNVAQGVAPSSPVNGDVWTTSTGYFFRIASATYQAAALSSINTFTAAQRYSITTLTDAATIAVDMAVGNWFSVVLGGNRTLGVPTNIVAGQRFRLSTYQDQTGTRTLAYAWVYQWPGNAVPTIASGGGQRTSFEGKVDYYSTGTFTVTIATPGVFTKVAHGLESGNKVQLSTTGALPTGLSTATTYFVRRIDADTFNLSTTRANMAAGTYIATSGSQSGVHTLVACGIAMVVEDAIT